MIVEDTPKSLTVSPMNFGFVSTRFSGTDGVSLEARKWAEVLERDGHSTFWLSGLSDRPFATSMVVPEAHFEHPYIQAITDEIWGRNELSEEIRQSIVDLTPTLKLALRDFVRRFDIDILIPQNASTIPMNIPLGLAIAEYVKESGMPTIAHHHDFFWERERFSGQAATPFLEAAFPPILPSISHVVINSEAARQLKFRFDIDASIIPNVMDFEAPPTKTTIATNTVREGLGFAPDDRIFLQPTRVVPRKGIEHAIELISGLDDSKNKLVISHSAGDEGMEYQHFLQRLALEKNVDLRLIGDRIATNRGRDNADRLQYTLSDLYPLAELVTYPSQYEGFGNALLEAVYFRKPVLVNRYSVFVEDIEPLGFRFAVMDGSIDCEVIESVQRFISDKKFTSAAAGHNFNLAQKHFGYARIKLTLDSVINDHSN
tara:strand:- start:230 stop:1519 length:1290 start_codon:yes stop_codon:yes gene_type:complete